jgi:hypothetical protein
LAKQTDTKLRKAMFHSKKLWFILLYITATLTCSGFSLADPVKHGLAAAGRGDYGEDIKILRSAAEKGDLHAEYELGLLYFFDKKNTLEGIRWITKAANRDYAHAQFFLAEYYCGCLFESKIIPRGYRYGLYVVRIALPASRLIVYQ